MTEHRISIGLGHREYWNGFIVEIENITIRLLTQHLESELIILE